MPVTGGRRGAPAWLFAALVTVSFAAWSQSSSQLEAAREYFCSDAETKPYCCRGDPTACVERLRKQLRTELGRAELARIDSGRCMDAGATTCLMSQDSCTPTAGLILNALLLLGEDSRAAAPEIRAALGRSPELERFAFRALVAIRSPEAVPGTIRRLGDPEVICRWSGLWAVEKLGSVAQAAVPALERLLIDGDWSDRADAAHALGTVRDPGSIAALERALHAPPASAQKAAAIALSAFGASAAGSVPTLEDLARRHWAWSVRRAAARAVQDLSGRTVLPLPPTCRTLPERQGDQWVISVGGRKERLTSLDAARPARRGTCAWIGPAQGIFPLYDAADVCVAGENEGEFGGSILAFGNTTRGPLRKGWNVNPVRAVKLGETTLVIEGISHMLGSRGVLTRLWRDPEEVWRADPILELPGEPLGFATTRDHKLLLLTWNKLDSDDPACPWTEERRLEPVYLLRIGPDGTVEELR